MAATSADTIPITDTVTNVYVFCPRYFFPVSFFLQEMAACLCQGIKKATSSALREIPR